MVSVICMREQQRQFSIHLSRSLNLFVGLNKANNCICSKVNNVGKSLLFKKYFQDLKFLDVVSKFHSFSGKTMDM